MAIPCVEQQIFIRFVTDLCSIGDLVIFERVRPHARQWQFSASQTAADTRRCSQIDRCCKWEAVEPDQTCTGRCGYGTGQDTVDTCLTRAVSSAGCTTQLIERRFFLFLHIARTQCQAQLIGDVEHIVCEDRPAFGVLQEPVFCVIAIGVYWNGTVAKRC